VRILFERAEDRLSAGKRLVFAEWAASTRVVSSSRRLVVASLRRWRALRVDVIRISSAAPTRRSSRLKRGCCSACNSAATPATRWRWPPR
jgi:hypothetical protein